MKKGILICVVFCLAIVSWYLVGRKHRPALNNFIGYTMVDCESSLGKQSLLKLRFYTTKSISTVSVNKVMDKDPAYYFEKMNLNRFDCKLAVTDKSIEGYLYEIVCYARVMSMKLTKMEIKFNDDVILVDIGNFTLKEVKNAENFKTQTDLVNSEIVFSIENNSEDDYYLIDTHATLNKKSHLLLIRSNQVLFYKGQIQSVNLGSYSVGEKYHLVSSTYNLTLRGNVNEVKLVAEYILEKNLDVSSIRTNGVSVSDLIKLR